MFSAQNVHETPMKRAPMPCSPGHWWLIPQPPIIFWLCSADALESWLSRVYAARPAAARAALMWASTAVSTFWSVPGALPLPPPLLPPEVGLWVGLVVRTGALVLVGALDGALLVGGALGVRLGSAEA